MGWEIDAHTEREHRKPLRRLGGEASTQNTLTRGTHGAENMCCCCVAADTHTQFPRNTIQPNAAALVVVCAALLRVAR